MTDYGEILGSLGHCTNCVLIVQNV